MKQKIYNLLLIFLSVYLTLIICDWVIKKINYRFLKEANKVKLETYLDNKLKKREAFENGFKFTIYPQTIENIIPTFDTKSNLPPISSFVNSKSFLCDEGYGLIKYKTDKFGFRNSNNVYQKPIDIIIIGDSFAHGACVDDQFSVAGILKKDFNVLNLGIGSTNPTHYALNLKIFEEHFKPKKIIVIFYSNDYVFNSESIYEKILKKNVNYFNNETFINNRPTKYNKNIYKSLDLIENKYVMKMEEELDQEVLNKQKKSFLKAKIQTLIYHIKLLEIKKLFIVISNKYSHESLPKNTLELIKLLKKKCNIKFNCTPLAILIPSSDYWDYDYRGRVYLKHLMKNLNHNKIDFIDFSNESKNRKFYAPKGIHLSKEGNLIVGEKILKKIK